MKVLVPIKRVIDANFRIRVRADGTGVDTSAAKMSMNPFDQIAVEQALRVKEAGGAMEIVLITIGPAAAQDVLRMGLAMGADRAILVTYEARAEPLTIAKLLAAVVELEKPSLVLMGKQAIDDDASQTGQMLAGLLDWPQATFASTLAVEDGKVAVTREVDGGSQSVRLSLPAVVTADLRLNQPRYASLPNIMKAKSKPLTMLEAQALGVDVRPRFEVIRTVEPPVRKRGKEVENVQELAGILKAQILSK